MKRNTPLSAARAIIAGYPWDRMRSAVFLTLTGLLLPALSFAASALPSNTTSAAVFIANYTDDRRFVGWGSGFFVDEAIIVTNKHVIEGGDWYRVYAVGEGDRVDLDCFRDITKSDVRINLDDDVAYARAYLPCDHGVMNFAGDPLTGDLVSVLGFPYRGSTEASLSLSVTTGSVLGTSRSGWILTDAFMDFGNSGGPVVDGENVVGVAVAKKIDEDGNFVEAYFIPSSVILDGLLYANDSRFGYTPRPLAVTVRSSSSSSSSTSSSSSYSFLSSSSSLRSSSRSSMSNLQIRTCARADRYRDNPNIFRRLNDRLERRFGFRCS